MGGLSFELVAIVVLLGVNAFLAASETSIVSARRARLQMLADEGNGAAGRVLHLKENPSSFLATVQVGITLAGFFASAVGAVSLARILEGSLRAFPLEFVRNSAYGIAFVLVTALLSFLSIVFGELVPKTLAVHRAESVALAAVRPLEVISRLGRPVIALLTVTTNLILRLFGVHDKAHMQTMTRDELLAQLEAAEDEGVVEAAEADLVEEAFRFNETNVRSVVVPRVDVVAVPAAMPLKEAIERFLSSGFSRLPVYGESLDDVVGILYVKDLFQRIWSDQSAAERPAAELARPAYFVPESKPIDELLAELRARRTHIAIVVDEYGGVAGLVTLEDLLEELVGEISDEFDPGHEPIREIEPGVLEVDGRLAIADLIDRLDLDRGEIGPVEAESVGGLIVEQVGRLPRQGDRAEIGPLRIEVRSVIGRRVGLARVERTDQEAPEVAEEAMAQPVSG
jgi:putative hemolysin